MTNSEIISQVWNEGTCGICACTWQRHDYNGYASFACFKEFASQCLEAKDKELAKNLRTIIDNLQDATAFPFAPSVKLSNKKRYELALKNVLEEATRIERILAGNEGEQEK